jgi:hypothetical protein
MWWSYSRCWTSTTRSAAGTAKVDRHLKSCGNWAWRSSVNSGNSSPLEGNFELLLIDAQHLKRVLGRETDVQDAEWLAELL